MIEDAPPGSAFGVEVVKRAPMLSALREGPMERRTLEQRLGVSKSTAHRNTSALTERGLVERSEGKFELTAFGAAIADVVATFEADVQSTVRLAPLFEVVAGIQPRCPVEAFANATVTSTDSGDPFAPLARFVSLVQDTETVRMFDSYAVAPTYMDEIHGRVLDGLVTDVVERPDVALDVMENYPQKCVELCASEYLSMRIHDGLPFGLVILDSRVGVGIRDPDTGAPRAFVDTDAPAGKQWAETLFDSYWNEATQLEHFHPTALREAIDADG